MGRIRRSRTGIGIITFIVLIVCGIVAYKMVDLEDQSAKANLRIEELTREQKEEEERAAEISNEKAYRQTPSYIEDVARDKLGLVYEDDIIFKPED